MLSVEPWRISSLKLLILRVLATFLCPPPSPPCGGTMGYTAIIEKLHPVPSVLSQVLVVHLPSDIIIKIGHCSINRIITYLYKQLSSRPHNFFMAWIEA